MSGDEGSMDGREDEVADVARRAALAASEKRRRSREQGDLPTAAEVNHPMMQRLGLALERIEAASRAFSGAMIFRGTDAFPLVSLLPDYSADDVKRTLGRVALGMRNQMDMLEDSTIGLCVDTMISTERGAVLVQVFGDDLLVVGVTGSPPDVAPLWSAMARERRELTDAAARLFEG